MVGLSGIGWRRERPSAVFMATKGERNEAREVGLIVGVWIWLDLPGFGLICPSERDEEEWSRVAGANGKGASRKGAKDAKGRGRNDTGS